MQGHERSRLCGIVKCKHAGCVAERESDIKKYICKIADEEAEYHAQWQSKSAPEAMLSWWIRFNNALGNCKATPSVVTTNGTINTSPQ